MLQLDIGTRLTTCGIHGIQQLDIIRKYTAYAVIFEGRKFLFFTDHEGAYIVSLRLCFFFEDKYFAFGKRTAKSVKFMSLENYRVYGICTGNYEERFVIFAHARKGKFLSMSGETVAYLDESFCV